MSTQEIPRDEWTSFFDTFSRQHEERLVTVEVLASDIGAQTEARELPLAGITATLKGSEPDSISIIVGDALEGRLTHTITGPMRVWLERTAEGANAALEIEAADGAKTLLRFRSALPPEMMDSVVTQ
jgi:hypothetical protein